MTAARRLLPILLFAVLPIAVAIGMFATAHSSNSLAADFHNELYPEAKLLLDWTNPFPGPDAALEHGHNLIWPPVAAFLIAPLTVLPAGAANWAIALIGLACSLLSLRIVGVRDWRVYGVFALWPSVIGEIRVSHLTPFLCVLLALAWRYREVRFAPGLTIGLAGASLLLVLPFTSIEDYLRTLVELGKDFDQDSYSPFGFLMQIGVGETPARVATYLLGAVLLIMCWRRASLGLAVAAALVLSPIVWLDYYAVAAVPLAIVRPRLSVAWFLPLATWGLLSAGIGAGNGWGSARVLIVFAVVFAVVVRAERQAEAEGESHRPATVGAPSAAHIDPKPSSG